MTEEQPRVRLHDVHVQGAADSAAVRAAIERAVARTLCAGQTQKDTGPVRDAVAAEVGDEVRP
jgi:hypothetical protein